MALAKAEIKQLLERLIFEDSSPQQWVEDVWGLSPLLGDTSAKLLEVFEGVIDCCPDEQLDNLLQSLYQAQMDSSHA
jgi:hypothetical protein